MVKITLFEITLDNEESLIDPLSFAMGTILNGYGYLKFHKNPITTCEGKFVFKPVIDIPKLLEQSSSDECSFDKWDTIDSCVFCGEFLENNEESGVCFICDSDMKAENDKIINKDKISESDLQRFKDIAERMKKLQSEKEDNFD